MLAIYGIICIHSGVLSCHRDFKTGTPRWDCKKQITHALTVEAGGWVKQRSHKSVLNIFAKSMTCSCIAKLFSL